jgi:hypothetical protein
MTFGELTNELGRMLRKVGLTAVAAAAVAAAVASLAVGDSGKSNLTEFQYAIGLWGDLPYSTEQENTGIPNLLADLNAAQIQFTVNDGDWKAGNGTTANPPSSNCDDALYTRALGWLNSLEKPAAFTPGDNDWTDCDRTSNGGFNSVERLDHERAVFFATNQTLGKKTLTQEVQSTPLCKGFLTATTFRDVPCVENRRWEFKGVMYATVNVPGTCNNLCSSGSGDTPPTDTDPNTPGVQFAQLRLDEYAARNAADIAWLRETFAKAKANGDAAVMIIGQADPGFDLSGSPFAGANPDAPTRDPKTLDPGGLNATTISFGFKDFLTTLRNESIGFQKPVVYVHGDTHYFRVDKPLLDKDGKRLENFTRVETFGDNAANGLNDVHWVKALVDPASRDVFAFQAQTVPGNVVTHSP